MEASCLSGDGSVSVCHGNSCYGSFDCIFHVFEDFDPTKLALRYQDWGKHGYVISGARYDKRNDDFCFQDGEFMSNLELTFG